MEILAGLLLGGLLFSNKCDCPTCVKAREKADREWAKWYKANKGSTSLSCSVSLSPSASALPSTQPKHEHN